ncbi:MAG: PAS domain S-box protein, partial [Proteobacteria bacterium]|nr:PAS domain S-box protein [Pseudomonadota bacterium]
NDEYNRVVLMNSAAEDLLGARLSMVIDRPIDFAIEEKNLREKVRETLDKKETGHQFDFPKADAGPAHPRIMRARTSVIRDRQGADVGIVTILHDVTREREVDRMKTEFITTAAHELRSPLTSIRGFSEILLTREGLGDEEKKRFLTHINKHSVRLAHIINDLLDITRIESGVGFSLDKAKCNAGEAIKSSVPFFQDLALNHEIEVVLPDEDVALLLDQEKIEQVLKNLLDNALKYSPDGGKIRVKGELFDDCYQV